MCSLEQKHVLELLLLANQFWFLSCSLLCSLIKRGNALLQMFLHLRHRLHLRLTNLSSAAVGWCFKL
jgi:hypothetical protein